MRNPFESNIPRELFEWAKKEPRHQKALTLMKVACRVEDRHYFFYKDIPWSKENRLSLEAYWFYDSLNA